MDTNEKAARKESPASERLADIIEGHLDQLPPEEQERRLKKAADVIASLAASRAKPPGPAQRAQNPPRARTRR